MPLPNPPKLYLDEHLSPRLVSPLRKNGFDVVSSQAANMLSKEDVRQLEFAISQQRALVTCNIGDFVRLHEKYTSEGAGHWGIILSTEESIGVLLHRLLRLLNSVSADELKNQVRWLNEFQ